MPNCYLIGIVSSLASITTSNIFLNDLSLGLVFKLVSKYFHCFFNASMSGGLMCFCHSKFIVVLTIQLECTRKHQSPFLVFILGLKKSILDYCMYWNW